jgi:hypothetical protein
VLVAIDPQPSLQTAQHELSNYQFLALQLLDHQKPTIQQLFIAMHCSICILVLADILLLGGFLGRLAFCCGHARLLQLLRSHVAPFLPPFIAGSKAIESHPGFGFIALQGDGLRFFSSAKP